MFSHPYSILKFREMATGNYRPKWKRVIQATGWRDFWKFIMSFEQNTTYMDKVNVLNTFVWQDVVNIDRLIIENYVKNN